MGFVEPDYSLEGRELGIEVIDERLSAIICRYWYYVPENERVIWSTNDAPIHPG